SGCQQGSQTERGVRGCSRCAGCRDFLRRTPALYQLRWRDLGCSVIALAAVDAAVRSATARSARLVLRFVRWLLPSQENVACSPILDEDLALPFSVCLKMSPD